MTNKRRDRPPEMIIIRVNIIINKKRVLFRKKRGVTTTHWQAMRRKENLPSAPFARFT